MPVDRCRIRPRGRPAPLQVVKPVPATATGTDPRYFGRKPIDRTELLWQHASLKYLCGRE
jgi:hypothetical protein